MLRAKVSEWIRHIIPAYVRVLLCRYLKLNTLYFCGIRLRTVGGMLSEHCAELFASPHAS